MIFLSFFSPPTRVVILSMIIENTHLSLRLRQRRQLTTAVVIDGMHTCPIVSFVEHADRALQLTIERTRYFHRSVEDGKRKCELTCNEADLLHVVNSRERYGTFAANFISRNANILRCACERACACLHAQYITTYYYFEYVYSLNSYVCHLNPSREKAVFPYLTPLVIPTPRISCVTHFLH